MSSLSVGLVLDLMEDVPTGVAPSWSHIRRLALTAEESGFDTVWTPDELLWQGDDFPGPRGFWENVAITAAVAEATRHIRVGTWVLSALHRNPALTAKVAATLDEISGGRLLFGFGAGHSGLQGKAFGYPEKGVVTRYEEALQIVLPLLREGKADFEGENHRASLVNRPMGPRAGEIPIMLAGHGRRTIGLAVRHADIWSAYAEGSSQAEAFTRLHGLVDDACATAGRDPETLGRSVGVWFVPAEITPPAGSPIVEPLTGTVHEVADQLRAHARSGATSVELMVWPQTPGAIDEAAAAVALLDR